MAKGTLTITDKEDGSVDCVFNFKPPLEVGKKMTKAQQILTDLAEAMGGEPVAVVTDHLNAQAESANK
jgi:hypothetical protein